MLRIKALWRLDCCALSVFCWRGVGAPAKRGAGCCSAAPERGPDRDHTIGANTRKARCYSSPIAGGKRGNRASLLIYFFFDFRLMTSMSNPQLVPTVGAIVAIQ